MTESRHWEYLELSLGELGRHTFGSITMQYRGTKPLCVMTALESLAGYSVVNVFPPRGAAFRAAVNRGARFACRAAIGHLYGDPAAKACFLKDLRVAKIRKELAAYVDQMKLRYPVLGETTI